MKMTLIAVAAAITAIGCQAATLPFNVTAPSWNKIAQCTTQGGVNIRKAPSTTAPKMVYNENKIEDYDCPVIYYGYWSTKSGGAVQSITFDGVAPVVSEQPGWVELLNQGPRYESNGWVSAKYCQVSQTAPIRESGNPKAVNFIILNTGSDVNGTYALYMTTDEMNGLASFYLGRIADGKLVCPYLFECDYNYDMANGQNPPSFTKNEYGGYTYTATKKGMSGYATEWGEEYAPDINKLTTEQLNLIISQAKPLPKAKVVYLYNNGYYLTD